MMAEAVRLGTPIAQKQPEISSASDHEAVRLAQQGEPAAFEELYRRHSRHVYSLCLRMTGNSGDAEELTQEAFLQVFRKIHTFRGEAAFSTWLHRLSVNTVLMRSRKKTLTQTPLEYTSQGEESGEQRQEVGAPDPALTGSIDRMHLDRAIAQLPPGYKRSFIFHDVLGYEHNEIAAIFGFSIGNSKSQLHKARIRLRELLRDAGYGSQQLTELYLEPL